MSVPAPVRLVIEDDVATITVAAGPANALSHALVAGLAEAVTSVEQSPARAVIICSGLDRYFGVGGDVKLFSGLSSEEFGVYLRGLRGVLHRISALEPPTVAVLDGLALGGGFELALSCDVRLLGPGAVVGFPEITLGLLPGATGTQRLTHLVGRARADELMLSGRSLNAVEARDLGLGLSVDADVIQNALAWTRLHLVDPGSAFRSIQRCTSAAGDPSIDGYAVELQEMLDLFGRPSARAGIRAFLTRRDT